MSGDGNGFGHEPSSPDGGRSKNMNIPDGRTSLHSAAEVGDVDRMKDLLRESSEDKGFIKDTKGRTPLDCAAHHGNIGVLRELLRACPESVLEITREGDTPLHTAVKYHQLEALKVLVEESINTEDFINLKDSKGNTVLHLAASKKQIQMIELLLKSRSIPSAVLDVNAMNSSGFTALDIIYTLPPDPMDAEIEEILRESGCLRATDVLAPPLNDPYIQVSPPNQQTNRGSINSFWGVIFFALVGLLQDNTTALKLFSVVFYSFIFSVVVWLLICRGHAFTFWRRFSLISLLGYFVCSMAIIWPTTVTIVVNLIDTITVIWPTAVTIVVNLIIIALCAASRWPPVGTDSHPPTVEA